MPRLSSGERVKGAIKAEAEDFIVEEIAPNGTILEVDKEYTKEMLEMQSSEEQKFSVFVMQKKNWNTLQALKAISNKVGRGVKSVGFAGTKDRVSLSTQLCSIFGANPDALKQVHIKDISVLSAWTHDKKIELGELSGNRFTITIRNPQNNELMDGLIKSMTGIFPNYFGPQRFGTRGNNFDVGIEILKGNFKEAIMKFLTDTSNETNTEAIDARKRLAEEQDFIKALDYFPTYLKYERSIIDYLSRYRANYANALRKLPRPIALLFVHSVEDTIFNKQLDNLIEERHILPRNGDMVSPKDQKKFFDLSKVSEYTEEISDGFITANILGYETKNPTAFEKEEMEKLSITLENFKAKGIKELSCKGSYRVMFAPYRDLSCNVKEDAIKLRFSLPASSYATVFLEELIEIV